jgi:uncharacterized Zn-binding protein involved in type VI secretion
MGKAACRLHDMCTGHGCFPPRECVSGSTNVFVNGRPFHREGDSWAIHCCNFSCHSSVLQKGSSSVFVNGKGAGRVGDPVACGSKVATGSHNVFVGG